MTFSDDLIRRLVLIKQIFLNGKKHAIRKGDLERLFAVIAMDQAIEQFLHTVIMELGGLLNNPNEAKFNSITNKANAEVQRVYNKDLPRRSEIYQIHVSRNLSQHLGSTPSDNDLKRFERHAEAFLRESFKLCFQKDFDEVFLGDIIIFEDVKEYFINAERALSSDSGDKYKNALVELATSFEFLKGHIHDRLPWENVEVLNLRIFKQDDDGFNVEEFLGLFDKVCHNINILASGGKLQDYEHFQKIAPIVNIAVAGNIAGIHHKTNDISKEDCIRAFNFVYDTILTTQSFR